MRSDDHWLMYIGFILLAPHATPIIGVTGGLILLLLHMLGHRG